ncbi:MAG: hypothetical protein JWQ34_734 [Mucilaginibacter sp.]|uniref:DUF4185 domain-containing protein n=1 Tax=Mucilaginibacter sp. TaxID=1882438 RepID=UPI00262AEF99|nr:DUF4185 domain-containing protein [Mucilaginibacter sp.]MDB5002509.1 hypothetical protein [Mucilaginibacter sp.]
MKKFVVFVCLTFLAVLSRQEAFCQATDLTTLKFSVSEAPEWSALLKRTSGWFGGDGIYTIPLNGKANKQAGTGDNILFLFSDSMIGEIRDSTLLPGFKMIHNSLAILKGKLPDNEKMEFYWDKDDAGKPESIFIPKTTHTKPGDYYWLGAGFVNQELGNNIYIFGYRVRNVESGPFGFREVGNTLIKIPAKPGKFNQQQQMDTPFFITDERGDSGSFGAGVYVNTKKAGAPAPDGYIYIYGVSGKTKNLLVARILPKDFEDFGKWTYWDGNNWNANIKTATKVTDNVSNELSLSPLPDGRFALVFQVGGMSPSIGLRIGKTPAGPFGPIIKIWDCKKDLINKNYLVYNAKAHPVLSKPGELLISYNINALDFNGELEKSPNLYRPRFIKIKFQ